MCGATPSRTGPGFTITGLGGMSATIVLVQLGLAKSASCRGRPTLRRSMSNAATTSISAGVRPWISQCISPMAPAPPAALRR